MSLKDYFENTKGIAVLSTVDKAGKPNAAIYARPHITDDGLAAFIMAERLSYSNVQDNPQACFLFQQEGPGHQGKRLYLKKVRETDDEKVIAGLRRSCHGSACCEKAEDKKHLVYFAIEKELPLVGE